MTCKHKPWMRLDRTKYNVSGMFCPEANVCVLCGLVYVDKKVMERFDNAERQRAIEVPRREAKLLCSLKCPAHPDSKCSLRKGHKGAHKLFVEEEVYAWDDPAPLTDADLDRLDKEATEFRAAVAPEAYPTPPKGLIR